MPCTTCRGAGRIRRQDRIRVALPAGMEDGETFGVEQGGDAPAHRGGKPGMLYVTVHVAPHARFRREGDDLWVDEEVSFLALVRGGSITVHGLDGKAIRVKIPKGTPSGKVFRVSGEGLPRGGSKRSGRGDLYATAHAHVPSNPSGELLSHLKDLADEL